MSKLRKIGVCLILSSFVVLSGCGDIKIKDISVTPKTERVMIVGGSSARGFRDPNYDSYIRRAFQTYEQDSDASYTIFDHAYYGGEAVQVSPSTFKSWLDLDHPQVVVISWGLLNDIHHHTPLHAFDEAIHDEIKQSLTADATVLLVTPPPVKASAYHVSWQRKFERYLSAEQGTAASFRSPFVYWLNLNRVMLTFLNLHHENVGSFCADSWHPNQAGHELGGQLLSKELVNTFGNKPIPTSSKSSIKHL